MRLHKTALALAMVLALAAAAVAIAAQRSPADATSRAAAPAGALPDLVVVRMRLELETGPSCAYSSTNIGVRVDIANIGEGGAGPFVLDVNGAQRNVDGLAAGAEASFWFAGYAYGQQRAVVDATSLVEESNEANNELVQLVPIPTLPSPCTPTPTLTPTPTRTPVAARGDADCNGRVNSIDAALVLQFEATLIASLPCPAAADVNGDRRVDSRDAFLMLQYVAGLVGSL